APAHAGRGGAARARRRRPAGRLRQRHPDRAGRGGGGQRPLRRAPDRRRQPGRTDQEAAMSAVSLPLSVAGLAGATVAAPAPPAMAAATVQEGAAVATPAPAVDSVGAVPPARSIDPGNAPAIAAPASTVAEAAPATAAEAFA